MPERVTKPPVPWDTRNVFLSHATVDADLAKLLATLIEKVTLGSITLWFSSDDRPLGGMVPGLWERQIREKLTKTNAIIPLITPASALRPWLLFEAGFGAAMTKGAVLPVCLGDSGINDLPDPLKMFQAYQLTDVESTHLFLGKLSERLGSRYDRKMGSVYVKPTVRALIDKVAKRQMQAVARGDDDLDSVILEQVKRYLAKASQSLLTPVLTPTGEQNEYSVSLNLRFPELTTVLPLPIRPTESVGDKMHEIYARISNHVQPFTYLEQWIIRDAITGANLVVREVADRIPASCIFAPGSEWIVEPLAKPYSGEDSWSEPQQGMEVFDSLAAESPDIRRPDTKDLLKGQRKVDPGQSRRYRCRTGE